MKNLLLLFFCSFLLFQCSDGIAQTKKVQVKNDLMEDNLKGKVKSLQEGIYEVSSYYFFDSVKTISEILKDSNLTKLFLKDSTFTKYDIKGNKIEGYNYHFCEVDCEYNYKLNIVYDNNNNKIKQTTKGANRYEKGIVEEIISYKYDNNGNKIEQIRPFSSLYNEKETFYYDIFGKQSSHHIIKDYGNYTVDVEKDTFLYDSSGFVISRNSYSGGFLYSKSIIKFNKQGMITEEIKYKPNDIRNSKSIFKFDTISSEIKKKKYDPDDSVISKSIYKYDSMCNVNDVYLSDPPGSYENAYSEFPVSKYTYQYKYDIIGNWLYRLKIIQADYIYSSLREVIEITERQIEYY